MIVLVRANRASGSGTAIRWNWPGPAMLRFLLGGIGFAFAVEFASRWLPIPKSLPVDKYFSDTAGAYLMAAFGITLAPLLEELFFRGMLYPVLRRAYGRGGRRSWSRRRVRAAFTARNWDMPGRRC